MKNILSLSQIAISIALISLILLQAKGVGLGTAWGGKGEFYQSRRGIEKAVLIITVILIVLFLAISLINLTAV